MATGECSSPTGLSPSPSSRSSASTSSTPTTRPSCGRLASASRRGASTSSCAAWRPTEGDDMTEYVVLIVGDADRWWTTMSMQERKDGYAEYDRFGAELA